jgi:hypothetical protein
MRQHFMERSFAQGKRLGLKRARWRGRWRIQIQDYLIAAAQNIELLIAHARPEPRAVLAAGTHSAAGLNHLWTDLRSLFAPRYSLQLSALVF